ncbi:32488_t:CDS:1, partial [Gigaspora margarita]
MDLSYIASSKAILIMNLTPDEKRGLLFNVNFPLEIPMTDFNDAWWPLVTNIWTQWNSYKSVDSDVSK